MGESSIIEDYDGRQKRAYCTFSLAPAQGSVYEVRNYSLCLEAVNMSRMFHLITNFLADWSEDGGGDGLFRRGGGLHPRTGSFATKEWRRHDLCKADRRTQQGTEGSRWH